MKDKKDVVRKLFEKYLAGTCTEEEKVAIAAYFDQDDNEAVLRELIEAEFETDVVVEEESLRTLDEVYRAFDWVHGSKKRNVFRSTLSHLMRPGIAAMWATFFLSLAGAFYYFRSESPAAEEGQTTATALAERREVRLSDGSVVRLNAASKLTYPKQFSGKTREVTLEGEAFFEVTPDAHRPFVIRSGTLKTTVLGTSFNVRAYREDKTASVAVLTGKVSVSSPAATMHIDPNQQAVFDKQKQLLEKQPEVSAEEVASWRTGVLRFRNATFSEVAAVLRRSRGVSIRYDAGMENCPVVHADFNEQDSTPGILETLMISINGSVEQSAEGVFFLRSAVSCQP